MTGSEAVVEQPPAVPGGWALRRQRVARHIEDCGVELFAEHGFGNVTVADVARRAGLAPSTVARYFPTKEDILLAVPRRVRQETLDAMERLADAADPLSGMIGEWKRMAVEHAPSLDSYRRWTTAIETAPETLGRSLGEQVYELSEVLTGLCARALDVDPRRDVTPRVLASALLAANDAVVRHWIGNDAVEELPALLDDAHRALLSGFGLLRARGEGRA